MQVMIKHERNWTGIGKKFCKNIIRLIMATYEEGDMTEEKSNLDLLIRHEAAIKRLYELFAEVFPEHRTFWEGLMNEEQRHFDLLHGLSDKESVKSWFTNDSRFKRLAIGGSIEYIEGQIERIRKVNITLLEALSIANDLEEALIEKQFISLNISGPEEIRGVMRSLVADTQRHRKAVAEKLNFYKGKTH